MEKLLLQKAVKGAFTNDELLFPSSTAFPNSNDKPYWKIVAYTLADMPSEAFTPNALQGKGVTVQLSTNWT